jgi:hypothetical protein
MDSNRPGINFEVEGRNLRSDGVSWSAARDFVDNLIQALAAMPDGPKESAAELKHLGAGCIRGALLDNLDSRAAVRMLRAGPTAKWTREMHRQTAPLYKQVREQGWSARLGTGRMAPMKIPPLVPDLYLDVEGSFTGTVQQIGGKDPRIDIYLERYERVMHCVVDRDVLRTIRDNPVYRRVHAKIRYQMNIVTREPKLSGAKLLDLEFIPAIGDFSALDALNQRWRDEGVTFDYEAALLRARS